MAVVFSVLCINLIFILKGGVKMGQEIHKGTIVKVDEDFTQIDLENEDGKKYTRFFETEFISGCGLMAGDNVLLSFAKRVLSKHNGIGLVTMVISKGKDDPDARHNLSQVLEDIDLEKIRSKFNPPLDKK